MPSIRLATKEDLPRILTIYDCAKQYMKENGNPTQWGAFYPSVDLLCADIDSAQLYVIEKNDEIHGVFAFILGEDITYQEINGAWLNQESYGTIHRIASDGQINNVFYTAFEFGKTMTDNIRVDTHEDNKTMQHLALKYGFVPTGVISLADGTNRWAYHYCNQ